MQVKDLGYKSLAVNLSDIAVMGGVPTLIDGIASDARHIADSPGAAIHIDLDKIPVSENLRTKAVEHGWDATELAVSAGSFFDSVS